MQSEESSIFLIKKKIYFKKILPLSLKFLSVSLIFISFGAQGSDENYLYKVQFGDLIVGQVEVSVRLSDKKLILNSKSKTVGVLNTFYNYKGELNASLTKNINSWNPNKFSTTGVLNNEIRSSIVIWDKNNLLAYENNPIIELKKFHPIYPETLINVIDPITAFIKVVERINSLKNCDTSLKIFDGRRRYDIKTKSLVNHTEKKNKLNSYDKNVIMCGLKIYPIGGHRLKTKWKPKKDKFSDIKIFFEETISGKFLPVRVNILRWFGTITVRLDRN